jgi:hypothetical protein
MIKKYKALKISRQGFLTDEKDEPIVCPIRNSNCNFRCAWFSAEERIIYCQNTPIGALRPKPMQSFRLHTGPDVYDLDESIEKHSEQEKHSARR